MSSYWFFFFSSVYIVLPSPTVDFSQQTLFILPLNHNWFSHLILYDQNCLVCNVNNSFFVSFLHFLNPPLFLFWDLKRYEPKTQQLIQLCDNSKLMQKCISVISIPCSFIFFWELYCVSGGICFHFYVDKIILSDPKDPFYHAPVNRSLAIWLILPIPSIYNIICKYQTLYIEYTYEVKSKPCFRIFTASFTSGLCVCCFLKERKCVVCDRAVIG